MIQLRTSACGRFGQPEFLLRLDPSRVIEPDRAFLVGALERWVAEGEVFRDGETVQFGWMVLKVRANADGTLSLLEPDFIHMPAGWIDSVTTTLVHLRLQKDVCESFFGDGAGAWPSLRESCLTCTRVAGPPLVMERVEPKKADCGWFIGCLDAGHDHDASEALVRVSLYEAILKVQAALPYLALPPGVLLSVRSAGLRVYYDEEERTPSPGSFVDGLGGRIPGAS